MQIADNLVVQGNINATGSTSGGGAQIANVTTVAAAGATQGAATAIPATATIVNITATTSSEGVRLPVAATGRVVTTLAPLTKGAKVYSTPAGTVINANTTATTAYALVSGDQVSFMAVSATLWRVIPASYAGLFTTLTASGLASLNGGLTVAGPQKVTPVTVIATGNAVGNARTVGANASYVVVTATASTEGVKLPTPSTGRRVEVAAPTAVAVLVYASAAGQSIGTGTTNTTAFKVTANTTTVFTAISTTKWRVSVA